MTPAARKPTSRTATSESWAPAPRRRSPAKRDGEDGRGAERAEPGANPRPSASTRPGKAAVPVACTKNDRPRSTIQVPSTPAPTESRSTSSSAALDERQAERVEHRRPTLSNNETRYRYWITPTDTNKTLPEQLDELIRDALARVSMKDAVGEVAAATGVAARATSTSARSRLAKETENGWSLVERRRNAGAKAASFVGQVAFRILDYLTSRPGLRRFLSPKDIDRGAALAQPGR